MPKSKSKRDRRKQGRRSSGGAADATDFNLVLSQDTGCEPDDLDDQDLQLWLSQSQKSTSLDESAISDIMTPTAHVQKSIKELQKIMRNNHNYMVKQNDILFTLVKEISVNVSEINDKVCDLENKFCALESKTRDLNQSITNNKDAIVVVKSDTEKLQKAMKLMEKNSKTASAFLEKRITAIENRLNSHSATPNAAHSASNEHGDRMVTVSNLPYGMKDEDDVNKLLREGLRLNVAVKSILRAPSVYNRAGVITIELESIEDKMLIMRNKWKLRQLDKYYDVYVNDDCHNNPKIIQEKLHMLVSRMTSNDHRSENSVRPVVPRQRYNLYQRNNNKD